MHNERGLQWRVFLLAVGILMSCIGGASAADLRVLAGGAMVGIWDELKPLFESATGHKIELFFGTTPNLIKETNTGVAFDVGLVPTEVMADPMARSKFASSPPIDIASVGLGVAVRAGSAKPKLATSSELRTALLEARSIATIPESAAGYSIMRAFKKLGIAEDLKPKIKVQLNPAGIVRAVASGEADLGIFLTNVLVAPGLDIAGPFPADVQEVVVFTASPSATPRNAAAAAQLMEFLVSPKTKAIIAARGMTPM